MTHIQAAGPITRSGSRTFHYMLRYTKCHSKRYTRIASRQSRGHIRHRTARTYGKRKGQATASTPNRRPNRATIQMKVQRANGYRDPRGELSRSLDLPCRVVLERRQSSRRPSYRSSPNQLSHLPLSSRTPWPLSWPLRPRQQLHH